MKTIYEILKEMSVERLGEWLYANCEFISSEYGACSGAEDASNVINFLNSNEVDV